MTLGNKIRTSLLVIFLLGAAAAPAYADLTVEFSDTVRQAVNPDTQKQVQDLINTGLKNRAKTDADARDLLGNNQTLKIICYGEPKADELGLKAPDPLMGALLGGFGETKGDFDAAGKPKRGGTVYIAIDCDKLRARGWFREFDHLAGKQTMWNVLVHELLHASNQGHRHPPEELSVYEQWVEAFNRTIRREIRQAQAATEKKAEGGKRVGAVPKGPTEMYALVNNQPEVLACIAPGQNPQEAAKALGMGNHQLVAGGPAGTLIRGPGDPQTVNRLAQDRKVTLCFPAEVDVCIIMTPLTPFRGHDHETHSHSGSGLHEHQPPDPPLHWGVTPPEAVIDWKELL